MNQTDAMAEIRRIMVNFPPLEHQKPGDAIRVEDIYFPDSHAAALDPERSLVIGNRGMGKSFWADALKGEETRNHIATHFPAARLGRDKVDVAFGFRDGEGPDGTLTTRELDSYIKADYTPDIIWRGVTLSCLAASGLVLEESPKNRKDWLTFVQNEPEAAQNILRQADERLIATSRRFLVVFDQLEFLSESPDVRNRLVRGILRLALACKSYRRIRLKIFMRPDQRDQRGLFEFPDASKIRGEAVTLDWRPVDVFGLLFDRLHHGNKEVFSQIASQALGICHPITPETLNLLREDESLQRTLFHAIAGPYMGSSAKRGFTYTWLPLHLADAFNQVSPRTFLRALHYAAEQRPAPSETAIDHQGIKEGVRQASANRVDDLKEDYPWVPPTLECLKGQKVPCPPQEMMMKWNGEELRDDLQRNIADAKKPDWMTDASMDDHGFYESLLDAMVSIGVIERRVTTGKVDVPDIFRLPGGILRKGGVTPQQRRRASQR